MQNSKFNELKLFVQQRFSARKSSIGVFINLFKTIFIRILNHAKFETIYIVFENRITETELKGP